MQALAIEVTSMAGRKARRKRAPWGSKKGVDLGPEIRRNQRQSRDDAQPEDVPVARGPSVVPARWWDPDDRDGNRRETKLVKGARVASPLLIMHRRGRLVTVEHLAAAERLLTAYEAGVLGAQPGRGRWIGEHVGTGRQTAYPQEVQLTMLSQFRAALRGLSGFQVKLVGHVVLGIPDPDRRDVAAFAAAVGQDENVCRGQLVAALDVLVRFFYPGGVDLTEREIDGLVGVA